MSVFLAGLPEDRLIALAEGRASFALVDKAGGEAVEPGESDGAAPHAEVRQPAREPVASRSRKMTARSDAFDSDAIAAQLIACKSVDEATQQLAVLKLRKDELNSVAKSLNIPPGRNMAETSKRILNLTVGARSKHAALRQG